MIQNVLSLVIVLDSSMSSSRSSSSSSSSNSNCYKSNNRDLTCLNKNDRFGMKRLQEVILYVFQVQFRINRPCVTEKHVNEIGKSGTSVGHLHETVAGKKTECKWC